MRIISGQYGGRTIRTAEGPGYRPATSKVRQAIFSMLESRGVAWEGFRVLDLFAGSGSLAIEALSRGAELAWFVEKSGKPAKLIRENLETLKVESGRYNVLTRDVAAVLKRAPEKTFDLAFIDPPYGKGLLKPSLEALMKHGWMSKEAFVLAEVEASVEPPEMNEFELSTDRLFGQTRILLWQRQK